MIFLGFNTYSDGGDILSDDKNENQITKIAVNNAVIGRLYVSQDADSDINNIWDQNTVINASFNGNLNGGNVDFLVENVDAMQILRREHGQESWIALVEFPINTIDDFNITYVDRYAENKTNVEYALVPIISGARGVMTVTEPIYSEFDGLLIGDKEKAYRAYLYQFYNTTRNQSVTPVVPLYGKYPFIVRTAQTNYTTGSLSATFVVIENNEINYDDKANVQHNEEIIDFLINGKPKLLKFDDGRSWIVDATSMPALQSEGALYTMNFEWTQIGRTDNAEDLYYNGLTTVPAVNS